MQCRAWYGVVIWGLLGTGCAAMQPSEPSELRPGRSYDIGLAGDYQGYRRDYRLHVPATYRDGEPAPLVVVVHGAFSTADEFEAQTGFSALADREGFIALYPNGIGLFGMLQHWNAGHCCGKAAADGVDDVGFLADAIADAGRRLHVDATRIYMVGFSNGAMLTHRFAAERTRTLAAIAAVAGPIGGSAGASASWRIPRPVSPLPVIMFHGTRDDTVPYEGASGSERAAGRRYVSALDSSRFWSAHNGCSENARRQSLAGARVVVDVWTGCDSAATVQLYSIDGWGHRWPGPAYTTKVEGSDPLYGFDAANVIWSFFERHPRGRPAAPGRASRAPLPGAAG